MEAEFAVETLVQGVAAAASQSHNQHQQQQQQQQQSDLNAGGGSSSAGEGVSGEANRGGALPRSSSNVSQSHDSPRQGQVLQTRSASLSPATSSNRFSSAPPLREQYRYRFAAVPRPKGGLKGVNGFQFESMAEGNLKDFRKHFADSEDFSQSANGSSDALTVPEFVLTDYACAFKDGLTVVQGRLFLSNWRVCFYYDFLGFGERRVALRYDEIRSVYKKNTAIVFPNAIEILRKNGETLFFAAFLMRDKAYASLLHVVQNHKRITEMYIRGGSAATRSDSARSFTHASESGEFSTTGLSTSDSEDDSQSSVEPEYRDAPAIVTTGPDDDDDDSDDRPHGAVNNSSLVPGESEQSIGRSQAVPVARPKSYMHDSGAVSDSESPTQGSLQHRQSLDMEGMQRMIASTSSPHEIARQQNQDGGEDAALASSGDKKKRAAASASAGGADALANAPPLSQHCAHMDRHDPVQDTQSKDFTFHTSYALPGFSVLLFWRVFLETGDFWVDFLHPKMEYRENTVTKWTPKTDASSRKPCCWERVVDFVSPVKHRLGPIAPKSTHIKSTQRVRLLPAAKGAGSDGVGGLVIDAVSLSLDVPYGDTFALINRFEVYPDSEGKGGVVVKMATRVKWMKSQPWGSSIIEKTVQNGGTEFCQQWRDFSFEYLRANRSRVKRIERKYAEDRKGKVSAATAAAAAAAAAPVAPPPAFAPVPVQQNPVVEVGGATPKLQLGALVFICFAVAYFMFGSIYSLLFGAAAAAGSPSLGGAHLSGFHSFGGAQAEIAALRQEMTAMRESMEAGFDQVNTVAMAFAKESGVKIDGLDGTPASGAFGTAAKARRRQAKLRQLQSLEHGLAATQREIDSLRSSLEEDSGGDGYVEVMEADSVDAAT